MFSTYGVSSPSPSEAPATVAAAGLPLPSGDLSLTLPSLMKSGKRSRDVKELLSRTTDMIGKESVLETTSLAERVKKRRRGGCSVVA